MIDPIVALPGSVGEMAFYGFLENYIRNAAKHGRQKENEEDFLKIGITVHDKDEDYYQIEIYDNRQSIGNAGGKIKETKNKIDELIAEEIINNLGERRESGWGIAEMTLCGELLRGNQNFTEPQRQCPKSAFMVSGIPIRILLPTKWKKRPKATASYIECFS